MKFNRIAGIILIYTINTFGLNFQKIVETAFDNRSAHSTKWLTVGINNYLAVAGEDNSSQSKIRIYTFDTQSEKIKTTNAINQFDGGPIVRSLDWVTANGVHYLAAGGDLGIELYKFEPAIPLLKTVTSIFDESEVNHIKWVTIGSECYLAVACNDPKHKKEVAVYRLNKNNSSLELTNATASFYKGCAQSVDWLSLQDEYYLAAGGTEATSLTQELRAYKFDQTDPSLTLNSAATLLHGIAQNTRWLNVGKKNYLTMSGYDGIDGQEIRLYSFNGRKNKLNPIESMSYNPNYFIQSIDWITIKDKNFLTVAGNANANLDVHLYQFDNIAKCLMKTNATISLKGFLLSTDWLKSNNNFYLALGCDKSTSKNIKIYKLNQAIQEESAQHGFISSLVDSVLGLFGKKRR